VLENEKTTSTEIQSPDQKIRNNLPSREQFFKDESSIFLTSFLTSVNMFQKVYSSRNITVESRVEYSDSKVTLQSSGPSPFFDLAHYKKNRLLTVILAILAYKMYEISEE
jgi:hypothetical protein